MLRTLFLETIEADFHTVLDLHQELGLDLVVTEPLFVGASTVGALPRADRPAILTVGFFPLPFSSPDVAPFGAGIAPLEGPLNGMRNRALQAAASHIAGVGKVRDAFADTIELLTGTRPHGQLFDLALATDVWAQASVPQFEYPPAPHAGPGPVRRAAAGPVGLPAARLVGLLGAPPDRARHPGHLRERRPDRADRADDPRDRRRGRAGRRDDRRPDPVTIEHAYGGPLPANVRVERFMPYDHLLPSAHVMVTNGGFGAVHPRCGTACRSWCPARPRTRSR